VLVTIGSMKGQTLLPLPPQSTVPAPSAEPSLKDQDKIHILVRFMRFRVCVRVTCVF